MSEFINLDRRFHDSTDQDLESLRNLEVWGDYVPGSTIGWPELLEYHRVVLLAEAGAGKTAEMRQQAKQLVEKGQFAFFVALEELGREPIDAILSTDEKARFDRWAATADAPAWFFLDSVDELTLIQGKLDRALRRLSSALEERLDRARIIVSCRPSDWRPALDAETIRRRLPVRPKTTVADSRAPSEEMFVEVLRAEFHRTTPSAGEQHDDDANALRTFVMLPMSDRQIERFARHRGMQDADAFLAAVRRHDAWTFARRPLDLGALTDTWRRQGALGTRAQQHETNVATKLQDDPARPGDDVLSEKTARDGAERLALALALTRTSSIRSPEQALDADRADGVLDSDRILPDWSAAERKALLRRALFDPATYGRVRFHHRSTQEYLAARRLRTLRERGMPVKALLRLLFATRYGADVAIPSVRAIAAWLALWDDAVCRTLMEREPEALLSLGDPESLDMGTRGRIVRKFVIMYGCGCRRGLNIPIAEVRRLAHPELAPVIRECWNAARNEDARELLIEMIWQGGIESSADLAREVAFDGSSSPYHRVTAIRALVACNRKHDLISLASNMFAQAESWPDRVVHGVAADLFPRFITANQLVELIERTKELKRVAGGFEWVSQQVAEAVDPLSTAAVDLRDGLANLVRRGRLEGTRLYNLHSRFEYVAPALATLCGRQLVELRGRPDAALVGAIVTAWRFGGPKSGDFIGAQPDYSGAVKARMAADAGFRRDVFWRELAFVDEIDSIDDQWRRFGEVMHNGLVERLSEDDRQWLLEDLADQDRPERRPVALHALIVQWRSNGKPVAELKEVRESVEDDRELGRILEEETAPRKPDKSIREMERERQALKRVEEVRENRRIEEWKSWRNELVADPLEAFSGAKREKTISTIWRFLRIKASPERYDVWDKGALLQAFVPEVADRAEDAFRGIWRSMCPAPWSTRSAEGGGRLPESWILGLAGVSAEATTPGWSRHLSAAEAGRATAYAMIELNGFAPFVRDIVDSHPEEVAKVVGGEARAEFSLGGDHEHLPVLHDLAYADEELQKLCAPYLLGALQAWASAANADTDGRWSRHLDQVLRILDKTEDQVAREKATEVCAIRYGSDPKGSLGDVWLRGLFRFDPAQGGRRLVEEGVACGGPGMGEHVVAALAGLFGDNDAIVFRVSDPVQHADLLGKLVRLAYGFVRPEDDRVHETAYTPDARDRAEGARRALFEWLCGTPGPEARRVLLDIAEADELANSREHLQLIARRRAAADAEFPPFDSEAVIALGQRYEAPPNDGSGLFAIMMDRLEDLAHDLAHDDFSDRRSVQRIDDEREMQRWLSGRLRERAKEAYRVMREEEVADGKRTDIRLATVSGADHRVVMEVKIADRWRVTDLTDAVRKQLVGQYLRHGSCSRGCLLLTYHGRRSYWEHPGNKNRLSFEDVVGLLEETARALEREHRDRIRVKVFGLDLSDP